MDCKYKVNIKNIQYNYKIKLAELQEKYKFNLFCTGGKYDDTEIREEIASLEEENEYLNSIVDQLPKVKVEGEYPTLDNTLQAKMKIDLKGNTYQNGTPTPDTPIDIQVVSGNNSINVVGKNLFDKDSVSNGYLVENGSLGATASTQYFTSDYIPIQPNTAYYKTLTGTPRTKYYDKNKQPLNTTTYQDISIGASAGTFTTPNNAYYLRVSVYTVSSSLDTVMINLGTTATTYKPYQSATYPINLPSGMEMCWIPDTDYQDAMFKNEEGHPLYNSSLVEGGWYKYGTIKKVVYNGSEDWGAYSDTQPNVLGFYVASSGYIDNIGISQYFSNYGSDIATGGTLQIDYPAMSIARYTKVSFPKSLANSLANFKTWLSTHNTIVYYVLATPTTTEITDSTLIEQLNDLENARSYNTQTNINQTNYKAPFIINASALYDLNNLITRVAILETE